MAATVSGEAEYDRMSELRAFDETKAGVKGLVDAGITKVPRIFHHPNGCPDSINQLPTNLELAHELPIIDMKGIHTDQERRKEIVALVRDASETWGFFQVINHGIPNSVLEEAIRGSHRFFDQDTEVKKQWYGRDKTKPVSYHSCDDLFVAPMAGWRDSLVFRMSPNPPTPDQLPEVNREISLEYFEKAVNVGYLLLELLSEGLGLSPSYLKDKIGIGEFMMMMCNYYPPCPQPELTYALTRHKDVSFLTVLLQDDSGGALQALYHNQWVDVTPIPGALVVNIGELLQLVSNDKYKSAEHRVLAKQTGPRTSVPCFFSAAHNSTVAIQPIQELLSEDNPPKYRATTMKEFFDHFYGTGLDGTSALQPFIL
ncbi:OLC1v1031945C1 [Oldenlandia corymbosa var. corymbosa]|uniref:OLC1v1031945C1 n=1 Tax=Oldenlandia corymbosa var. corymbosa TaxID=529605 RepID=A0AAV1CMJ6_OLDCO|nr:OLC1v1031945C1 [Oldenlandia corymbosa var. corymbosa]